MEILNKPISTLGSPLNHQKNLSSWFGFLFSLRVFISYPVIDRHYEELTFCSSKVARRRDQLRKLQIQEDSWEGKENSVDREVGLKGLLTQLVLLKTNTTALQKVQNFCLCNTLRRQPPRLLGERSRRRRRNGVRWQNCSSAGGEWWDAAVRQKGARARRKAVRRPWRHSGGPAARQLCNNWRFDLALRPDLWSPSYCPYQGRTSEEMRSQREENKKITSWSRSLFRYVSHVMALVEPDVSH